MKFAKLVKKSNSSASLLGIHFQNFIPYKKRPKAVSYSSQILKVKFFTLDDDELVDPSFQN